MLPRVNIVRTDHTDYLLFSTVDAITKTIEANGAWAPLLIDIALTFCSGIEAPLILDVGANLGAFSIPIAQKIAAGGGAIFAFEPQRIVYYQLCGNIFLNRLDNVHAFNVAIGSAAGEIDIPDLQYANCENVGGFTLSELAKTVYKVEEIGGSNIVQIQCLDALKLPRAPDLIKVDVEGFELEVLKGSRHLLSDSGFPPMLLEASTQFHVEQRHRVLQWLEEFGYGYFCIADEVIAQHPSHSRQFQFGVNEQGGLNMTRVR